MTLSQILNLGEMKVFSYVTFDTGGGSRSGMLQRGIVNEL
jgi:hypothetical protein